jgi:ribosomal protein L23
MKTNKTNTQREESTYALIVRSQEKKRLLAEAIAYGLIVLSVLAAIWEFGEELFWFQS